jgi:hypothetical protein
MSNPIVVGIDVHRKTNTVCAMDSQGQELTERFTVDNNSPDTDECLRQYIKSKIDFALIKSLEALKQELARILNEECSDPVVASITVYSYIVDAVVALMHT